MKLLTLTLLLLVSTPLILGARDVKTRNPPASDLKGLDHGDTQGTKKEIPGLSTTINNNQVTVASADATCGVPRRGTRVVELEKQANPFTVIIDRTGNPLHYYSFRGSYGTTFYFSTCGLTDVDTSMSIWHTLKYYDSCVDDSYSCKSQTEMYFTVWDDRETYYFRPGTFEGKRAIYQVYWRKIPPEYCVPMDNSVPLLELEDQPNPITVVVDDNGLPDHYYTFSGFSGTNYIFSTCGQTSIDTALTVWNSNYLYNEACSDDFCKLQSEVYIYAYDPSVVFYLIPGTFEATPGTFNLSWTMIPPVPGTCGIPNPDADVLELSDQPSTFSVVVDEFGNPDHYYTFSGPTNTTFVFSTCGITSVDTSMSVWDALNENIVNGLCYDDSCGLQTMLAFKPEAAETLYNFRPGTFAGIPATYSVEWYATDECYPGPPPTSPQPPEPNANTFVLSCGYGLNVDYPCSEVSIDGLYVGTIDASATDAILYVSALDVDFGEVDAVYLNGNYLGVLQQGGDGGWSLTALPFTIDSGYILENDFNTVYVSMGIDWCVQLSWLALEITVPAS